LFKCLIYAIIVVLLFGSAEPSNLRKFKSLASRSCTFESLAYFFIMEPFKQFGTIHTPLEEFTVIREGSTFNYFLASMQVVGCTREYLGLFVKTKDKSKRLGVKYNFIANFRIGPHGIPREEAVARLKAKAE